MQVLRARAVFSASDCATASQENDASSSVANTHRIVVPVYFGGFAADKPG